MKSCTTELGARFFSVGLPSHRELDGKTPVSKRLMRNRVAEFGKFATSRPVAKVDADL
jgi:hypothetical protein